MLFVFAMIKIDVQQLLHAIPDHLTSRDDVLHLRTSSARLAACISIIEPATTTHGPHYQEPARKLE